MVVAEALTATEGVTGVLTLMVIGDDVAVAGEAHVTVDVITQVITSLLFNAAFA